LKRPILKGINQKVPLRPAFFRVIYHYRKLVKTRTQSHSGPLSPKPRMSRNR
jgi:hypothetical protein